MKLTGVFVTVCAVFVFFAACKKKEPENNLSAKAQLLVAGKWQMSASTATINYMGKDSTMDLYTQEDECDKDDFILFADNGKVTIDEAANKCPDDQQIETANWVLLNSDSRLAIVDSNPDTFDVEIASTQFKLKLTLPNSSGTPVTYIETYKNIK
jgi:hypothetical protein